MVNPKARGAGPGRRAAVIDALRTSFDVDAVDTRGRGHATELAAVAGRRGADVVVALGGDGTVNEIVNAIAGTEMPFAALPGGGANIFARALGMPWDPVGAARALAAVERDRATTLRIPLGRMNGRYFASNCGVGFDAAIVRGVERRPGIKRAVGDWFFVWTGVRLFFGPGWDRRRPRLRLSSDATPGQWQDGVFLAIVQNLAPFTYLGRRALRVCPDVRMEGALDCFALDSMSARTVLPVLRDIFGDARHVQDPHAIYLRERRTVCVRAHVPMPVQVDGEYAGEHDDVVVESVPSALSVFTLTDGAPARAPNG